MSDLLKSTRPVSVDEAIEILNELYEIDPVVIKALFNIRVRFANLRLAAHPTLQVSHEDDGCFSVGILGLLNALFGIQNDGYGFIASSHSEIDEELLGFCRWTRKVDTQP